MIGDWVYVAHRGSASHFGKVSALLPSGAVETEIEGAVGLSSSVDPIPLTPEILEKNGWYRAKFDGGYGRKGIRLEGPYNELNELPEGVENALHFAQWSIDEHFEYHLLDIYMWKGSVHLWIEYVHELQHALRLCGIDKQITI